MSKLRIVHIITNSNQGGAQNALFRLAREMRRRGHEVEVWFLYGAPDGPEDLPVVRSILDVAQPGLIGYLRVFFRLVLRLRRERPDVVVSFLPLASSMGQIGARLAGVRCRLASQRNPYWSYGRIMQVCDRLAGTLGLYTTNVANSRSVLDSFAAYPRAYRRRMTLVYNGIDWRPSDLEPARARAKFDLPAEVPLVVTVGRLTEQKNQAVLLDALSRLPAVHLALAGDGNLRADLTAQARRLGIAERVHFLGAVAAPDVADLLRAADLFVLPSRYEGQSNALLEAMNEGLPILASDLPSQSETLRGDDEEPAGWLLPLDDPVAWAQAIAELVDDPALRARMADQARRTVAAYSLERMGNGFEQAFRADLEREPGGRRPDFHAAPHRPPRA